MHPIIFESSLALKSSLNICCRGHRRSLLNFCFLKCSRPIYATATHRAHVLHTSPQLTFAQNCVEQSPLRLQPYLKLIRADKPIGTWLLYWPCTWSIAMSSLPGHLPDVYLLALFGAGAFFMRGAGCIINDLWDRDFDRMVERTKSRPLASGQLNSLQALTALGGLLGVSLGILLQLNWYSIMVGAASMGLVISYPLAKRFTYWPQIILGITLNWGVLLAWLHIQNSIETAALLPVFPLYIACICQTVIYDTIYSHQDKSDDIMIGVKSTALKFGDNTKYWLSGFSLLSVGGFGLCGYLCDQTLPFYAGLGLVGSHLAWQVLTLKINNADDCWNKFRSNKHLGLILFMAIVAGNLMKNPDEKVEEDELY